MPILLRTDVTSSKGISALSQTQLALSKSIGRISTGLKHAGFSDGASEMAFGQKLRADQISLKAAMANTNHGMSYLSVGEDALNQVYSALTKMREIAVSATNGVTTADDRATYNTEFGALRTEVSRILGGTSFNGNQVISSSASASLVLQVGFDATNVLTLKISTFSASLGSLGVTAGLNVTTTSNASSAITQVDSALHTINAQRSKLGVFQTKLENVLSLAQAEHEAFSTAISSILDVDYAEESASMTRFQIMQQAGVAALGQARSIPQSVLSLLG